MNGITFVSDQAYATRTNLEKLDELSLPPSQDATKQHTHRQPPLKTAPPKRFKKENTQGLATKRSCPNDPFVLCRLTTNDPTSSASSRSKGVRDKFVQRSAGGVLSPDLRLTLTHARVAWRSKSVAGVKKTLGSWGKGLVCNCIALFLVIGVEAERGLFLITLFSLLFSFREAKKPIHWLLITMWLFLVFFTECFDHKRSFRFLGKVRGKRRKTHQGVPKGGWMTVGVPQRRLAVGWRWTFQSSDPWDTKKSLLYKVYMNFKSKIPSDFCYVLDIVDTCHIYIIYFFIFFSNIWTESTQFFWFLRSKKPWRFDTLKPKKIGRLWLFYNYRYELVIELLWGPPAGLPSLERPWRTWRSSRTSSAWLGFAKWRKKEGLILTRDDEDVHMSCMFLFFGIVIKENWYVFWLFVDILEDGSFFFPQTLAFFYSLQTRCRQVNPHIYLWAAWHRLLWGLCDAPLRCP